MRRLVLTALFAIAASGASADARPLDVTLAPAVADGAVTGLDVTIRTAGDADGETVFTLPDDWGGTEDLWQGLTGMTADGGTLERPSDTRAVIRHAPGAAIALRYRIAAGAGEATAGDHGNDYTPVVRPHMVKVIGWTVIAAPQGDGPFTASLTLAPLPAGWQGVTSFGPGTRTITDVTYLLRSISFAAADLRLTTRDVAGVPFTLAARGTFTFTDEALADLAAGLLGSQRRFWRDPGTPFLVTLLPLEAPAERLSIGGTGLDRSFALYATTNGEFWRFRQLLAHETLHTWIPQVIGGLPRLSGPEDPAEREAYWFSEGFTEFYTWRLLARDGTITPADWRDGWNGILREYALSPFRTAPNAEAAKHFWTDQAAQRLPYVRGMIFAALADRLAREATMGEASLDDVMHAMQEMARGFRGVPANALFPMAFQKVTGRTITPAIERHIAGGEALSLASEHFGRCARVETVEEPVFALGFDGRATRENGDVVTGVAKAGPAWRAGLRDGMRILERLHRNAGDSQTPLIYRVDDGGTERTITFLPAGDTTFTLQRLVLADPVPAGACLSAY